MPTIISYNVNGIRAALKKDWALWAKATNADVIALQETKAHPDQLDLTIFDDLGYHHYWFSAEKKGYSGVALLCKEKPLNVVYGCGIAKYDFEGRVIRADFKDFSVLSVYFPSGTTGGVRQVYKMEFLSDFQTYINELKKEIPNLIVSGDYNICHEEIDIHNPVSNKNSSGFLPEERAWMSSFLKSGFIDSFRAFTKAPHHYSWWSYRAASRERNKGWRIDYNMLSETLLDRFKRAAILPEAKHSDHCPVLLELN
ncbi:exodeoxyribonuclease III [Flavobacteriales bacterium]|jgi:exodeoxyribonuclease-3|nr:exodeoxyribonuclease III [Flavobacteriales bacterium]